MCINHHPHALTSQAALPKATSCRGRSTPLQTNSSPKMLSRKKGSHAARIQYRPGPKEFIAMNDGCKPASCPRARRMSTQAPVGRETATMPRSAQSRSPALIGWKRRRTCHVDDTPARLSWNSNQPPAINIGAKRQTLVAMNHCTTGSDPLAEINSGMTTRVANSINSAAPPKRIAVAPSPSLGRDFISHTQKRLQPVSLQIRNDLPRPAHDLPAHRSGAWV